MILCSPDHLHHHNDQVAGLPESRHPLHKRVVKEACHKKGLATHILKKLLISSHPVIKTLRALSNNTVQKIPIVGTRWCTEKPYVIFRRNMRSIKATSCQALFLTTLMQGVMAFLCHILDLHYTFLNFLILSLLNVYLCTFWITEGMIHFQVIFGILRKLD